jgi:hypothetical protein
MSQITYTEFIIDKDHVSLIEAMYGAPLNIVKDRPFTVSVKMTTPDFIALKKVIAEAGHDPKKYITILP